MIAPGQRCQWFALCMNDAAVLVPHPVLGDVPTCHRCAQRRALAESQVRP